MEIRAAGDRGFGVVGIASSDPDGSAAMRAQNRDAADRIEVQDEIQDVRRRCRTVAVAPPERRGGGHRSGKAASARAEVIQHRKRHEPVPSHADVIQRADWPIRRPPSMLRSPSGHFPRSFRHHEMVAGLQPERFTT
jgi:hypothetical protein